MMTVQKCLDCLKNEIHSVVFATVGDDGKPYTCVIDVMLAENEKLYFLTAKGKGFYDRIMKQKFVALTGMKGSDTMSIAAISIRGSVRNIGNELLGKIFDENPYMNKIYQTPESRMALEVFEIYEGEIEYFNLSEDPIRQTFTFGNLNKTEEGYFIGNDCIQCGLCMEKCPTGCIQPGAPFVIQQGNCLYCGNCFEVCPVSAVKKWSNGCFTQ